MVFCLEHPKRDQNLKFTLLPASPHLSYGSPPAPGICSRQFQFFHGNFNLLMAISICSRQFQFAHGDFNFLTAISQFYSGQFQLFHSNAHGIFRFSHHLSATAADSGHAPKVKTQNRKWILKVDLQRKVKIANQKSIYELAELGGIYMRLGRTQTGVSSYLSPYISFHAFTELKMNSDRSDFISVADPTRVTFVPV